MKMKRWLQWDFVKEGFINLFWGFHKLVLFGFFTLVLNIGIITIGPAFIALCSVMRKVADDSKVGIFDYFNEFKRTFVPGLILSGAIIISMVSIFASYTLYAGQQPQLFKMLAAFALAAVIAILFLLFYYPFAAYEDVKPSKILMKSIYYAVSHAFDTIVLISLLYVLFRIMLLVKALLFILYMPLAVFIMNRYILANNKEIQESEAVKQNT